MQKLLKKCFQVSHLRIVDFKYMYSVENTEYCYVAMQFKQCAVNDYSIAFGLNIVSFERKPRLRLAAFFSPWRK